MFAKRRSSKARRNQQKPVSRAQIGQPQLLHSTYNNNQLSPSPLLTLAASSAPEDYFRTPLEDLTDVLNNKHRRLDDSVDSGRLFVPGHRRDASSVYSQDDSAYESYDNSAYTYAPPLPDKQPMTTPIRSFPAQAAATSHTGANDATSPKSPVDSQQKKGYFSSYLPTWRGGQKGDGTKSPEEAPPAKSEKSVLNRISGSKVAERIQNMEKKETRWDPYKGEPRKDGGGKPGQVRPNAWEQRLNRNPSYNVSISSGNDKAKKPTWTERAKNLATDTLDSRPPWKGGGGRSATVDPVQDTAVARTDPSFSDVKSPRDSGNPPSPAPKDAEAERPVSPVSMMGGRFEDDTAARNDSTLATDQSVSPIAPKMESKLLPAEKSLPLSPALSTTSGKQLPVDSDRDLPKSPVPASVLQNDPESWSTVNTSSTLQRDSPPPSPPAQQTGGFLSRVLWGQSAAAEKPETKQPDTKQPLTPPPFEPRAARSVKPRPLPHGPSVSSTMSHVENLLADEERLASRRRALLRAIEELKRIDGASPLDVDWKTAKANKRRLDERLDELLVLERESHELGLSIVRARRKADREEGLESGLWVRKVTG